MPDIKKYFPGSKVSDWTGGSFGAAGPGAKALGGTVYTQGAYTVHYFTGSSGFADIDGGGLEEVDVFVTGDISHRYLLKADDANIGLLQVGHITTEIPGMKKFVKNLNKDLNQELEYLYKDFYE